MKTLKLICSAAILALALTGSVYAEGQIETPGFAGPRATTTLSINPAPTSVFSEDLNWGVANIWLTITSMF